MKFGVAFLGAIKQRHVYANIKLKPINYFKFFHACKSFANNTKLKKVFHIHSLQLSKYTGKFTLFRLHKTEAESTRSSILSA